MGPAGIAILVVSLIAAASVGGNGLQHRAKTRAADAHALELEDQDAKHAQAMEDKQGELLESEKALSTCRAEVTRKSLREAAQGTTDALGVALAPELAEIGLRASVLHAVPRDELTAALIATGSDRMIAADSWMARCETLFAIGVDGELGCGSKGEAVGAYLAALEAQAGCPEPPRAPALDPAGLPLLP